MNGSFMEPIFSTPSLVKDIEKIIGNHNPPTPFFADFFADLQTNSEMQLVTEDSEPFDIAHFGSFENPITATSDAAAASGEESFRKIIFDRVPNMPQYSNITYLEITGYVEIDEGIATQIVKKLASNYKVTKITFSEVNEIVDYAVKGGKNADVICFRAPNVAPKGTSSSGGAQSMTSAREMQMMLRGVACIFGISMAELWVMFARMGMRKCVHCGEIHRPIMVAEFVCNACTRYSPDSMRQGLELMRYKTAC